MVTAMVAATTTTGRRRVCRSAGYDNDGDGCGQWQRR
jgi:hypothetical protein